MYRLVIEPQQQQGTQISLTAQQCHYLTGVVRLKDGDRFIIMNGLGSTWIAQLKAKKAEIVEEIQESTELPLSVTSMVALPKGNGFDDVVRCCTELGVSTLMPILSERTLVNPSPHKVERWRRIATEATEQSERQKVPQIETPVSFTTALSQISPQFSQRYLCVTRRKTPHLLSYLSPYSTDSIIIATGAEGGWTDEEIEKAIAQGFQLVSLGSRILRAITAPIVALSLVSATLESINS